MAFNPAVVETIRKLAPSQRTTLLVSRDHVTRATARPRDTVAWAKSLGATDLGLEHTLIDADVVTVAHAHGLRLGAWTANDETALRRLVALGVDGITTDHPDLAVRLSGR